MSTELKPSKLDLSGRKRSKWQTCHAYSHLFYTSKLKAIIDKDYTDYCASLAPGAEPVKIITWRNQRIRELYAAETDDVKAQVEALCLKTKPSTSELKAVDDMMAEGLPAEQIQAAVRRK